MPTPIPQPEKDAFIELVLAAPYPGGAFQASRMEDLLNNYDDIYMAITRQLEIFAGNNGYLTEAMAVFDDTELRNVGIYNNTTETSLVNPKIISNTIVTDEMQIQVVSPVEESYLIVIGNSRVAKITVDAGADLIELYIGPNSIVDLTDSTADGASINTIRIPFIKSTPATLTAAVYLSQIGQILVEPGSYFGGYINFDPESSCAVTITDLAGDKATHNSVTLSWTPPSAFSPPEDYLFINIYYRISGSNTWILADTSVGYFNGDFGFTFNALEEDTHYDFYVAITCLNGGISNSEQISVQTICCG